MVTESTKDFASIERPSIPVSSDTDLIGIAHSLDIGLQLTPFPYKLKTDPDKLILQIRRDNEAEDLETLAMETVRKSAPDYVKRSGRITFEAFLHPNVLGNVLQLYRDKQLTEEQCLAFLAENKLLACATSVVRTQHFIDQLELTETEVLSDNDVLKDIEGIEYSLKTFQIYVQLAKKLREKPELREQVGKGLLEEERNVTLVK